MDSETKPMEQPEDQTPIVNKKDGCPSPGSNIITPLEKRIDDEPTKTGHGPPPKDQKVIDLKMDNEVAAPRITVLDASTARAEAEKQLHMVTQDSTVKVTHDTRPTSYEEENFGKSGLRQIKCEGKYYKVDYYPLGPDITPFSEPAPESRDIMPISRRPEAINHENSTIYSYCIPDVGLKKIEDGLAIKNISYQQHIPAVAVLHSNIHGAPVEPNEIPIVMSLSPSFTSSYLHDVQSKFNNGALDLRYVISMGDKHKEKEVYNLGHIWVPLTKPSICWLLSPSNWDHANIKISPAFAELYNLKMNSHKDMVALTNAFRFADSVPQDITHSILAALRRVADVQLGLSRLYWRLWVLYVEAALNESMLQDTIAHDIVHAILPREISSATHLNELMNKIEAGIQPFFVTEPMLDFLHGIDLINILFVALSHSFEMNHTYGLTECLPGLGSICMIVPKGMLSSITSRVKLCSNDIYYVLRMFGYFTNQTQLIEEIGRTVSTFLVRPEGDHSWLGHDLITMELPYFKCAKTIMFLWKLDCEQQVYEMKARSIYKLSWVGMVRYMMLSLAANAVLTEMGLFTVLQLEALKIRIPKMWFQQCNNIIGVRGSCNKFNALMVRFGLRCNWGVIMNRMLYSVGIVYPNSSNFTRILQWSDWLMMNRELIEGTFMAASMCHARFTELPEMGIEYVPNMLSVASDDADIYYRMSIRDVCPIMLHVRNDRGKSAFMEFVNPLVATNGLPLDGQFRRLDFHRSLRTWFTFRCTTREAMYEITHEWAARREYYWELTSKRNFRYQGTDQMAEDYIEVGVDSFMPTSKDFGTPQAPELDMEDLLAYDDREQGAGDPIVFGSPSEDADAKESTMYTCKDGGRISHEEYANQQYPIHYCQADRNPTVGLKVWRHGFAYGSNRCGTKYVRLSTIQQYIADAKNEPTRFVTRTQRQLLKRRRKPGEAQGHIVTSLDLRSGDKEAQYFLEERHSTSATSHVKIKPHQEPSGERLPVRRSFFPGLEDTINSLIGYAKMMAKHDLSNDPLIEQTQSLTALLDVAPGASEGMRNRIISFLYRIDEIELNKHVAALPQPIRGEYCRTFYNVMLAISKNIPNTNTHSELYKKELNWFSYASQYLQTCSAMSEAELHDAGIHYDPQVMNALGFRDIRGEIDILRVLYQKDVEPKVTKQLIQQGVDSYKQRIISEPTSVQNFQVPSGSCPATSERKLMPKSHMEPASSVDQGATPDDAGSDAVSALSDQASEQLSSSSITGSASNVEDTADGSPASQSRGSKLTSEPIKKLMKTIGIKKE